MSKFIVTGGCGFIGSHLVDALTAQGHQVLALDDLSSGKKENLNSKASLQLGDIREPKIIQKSFSSEITGCFHLAAIASVEKSTLEWAKTHSINSLGAIRVFEAAAQYKIPVMYASSAAVYGASVRYPLSEKAEVSPLSAYGVDKYSNELHGKIAAAIHATPTIGFRFFNVYGPRQDPASPYSGVISIFIKQILENKPFTINGSGHQIRDFIYVKDVVKALIAGMDKKIQRPQGAEIYNVCSGKPISLLELAECLEKITGKTMNKIHKPQRVGDIRKSWGDPALLAQGLGVKAEVSLQEGLNETLQAFKRERLSYAS